MAEGEKTKEQVDYLTGISCDGIQGFYFSRPLPEDEAVRYLSERNR